MKPFPVQSTKLTTVAYDADRELLQLEFRDQAVYRSFDVPAHLHCMKTYCAPRRKAVTSMPSSEANSHMLGFLSIPYLSAYGGSPLLAKLSHATRTRRVVHGGVWSYHTQLAARCRHANHSEIESKNQTSGNDF
jgi:hypothetical protein